MAIDIRATVTCSLGTLISASLSDDYVQGTGLIKCKGSCEISGTITPAIGTVVTFSYTKGGVTTQVPRKLRVLSSFADPFRRTTKVELGCKLTYLQDLQEPIKWDAFDDSANSALSEADAQIITIPIHASSVANKCLTELGITASSVPLTNKFSVAEFDFGSGYVSILSDLLVSESYCGYLDTSEVLQVFSLDQEGGTGPVLDSTKIIDLGPIGVGQLPGEAVTVSYSTLKLKAPDGTDVGSDVAVGWASSSSSKRGQVVIPYDNEGTQATQTYTTLDTTEEQTLYDAFYIYKDTEAQPEVTQVVRRRETTTGQSTASVAGTLATSYLSNGIGFQNYQIFKSKVETFDYDAFANEVKREEVETGHWLYIAGSLGIPMVFSETDYVAIADRSDVFMGRTVTRTQRIGTYTKTIVERYGPWFATLAGQQAIAEARDAFTTASQVTSYLAEILSGEHLLDVSISTQEALQASQKLPSPADQINSEKADGDPANGYRTESKADLELALGSATAQRRIELSLPYAPDDTFTKTGGVYKAVSSDAAAKANRYGRCQNRLLLGNRNGMNVQAAPENLPAAPFAPVVVQANGLSALYRTNGTSYTMDGSGIVASSDLLFWGAVGGTGTFWFPVAPGITTLPSTPAVVNGEMTVSSVVPAYNETLLANARTKSTLAVTAFGYALELLTQATLTSRSTLTAATIIAVKPAVIDVALAALAPAISTGAAVAVPALSVAVEAYAPAVVGGASVAVPVVEVLVNGLDPADAGPPSTKVLVPAAALAAESVAPAISTGASVVVPAADVVVVALTPDVTTAASDPNFSSVSLLLHMDGSNGSTTFTDNSSNALSVTANGDAQISTAQSKWGTGALRTTRSTGSLGLPTTELLQLTGDFTLEFWIYALQDRGRLVNLGGSSVIELNQNTSAEVGRNAYKVYVRNLGVELFDNVAIGLASQTWRHFALTRSGTDLRLFGDGTLHGTVTNSGTFTISGISGAGSAFDNFDGYIDDLRITKGVARYTSNFTPPTAAFPDQ